MTTFNKKTAFITGGASGIGLGMAKAFLNAGANVAIGDINEEQLLIAEKELKTISENVISLKIDTTDPSTLESASTKIGDSFGHLHYLCNNAGIPGGSKILETPEERWRLVHEVNFMGPLNGINLFLPQMLEHGEASHIVNTSSFSGIHGHGNQSAYGSSKFALVGMSEFLRNDLKDTNVSVSVLCPHVVDTNIISKLKARVSGDVLKMINQMAVDPSIVGDQVLKAIIGKEFYIFCDGVHTREMLKARCDAMLSAMDRQFPEEKND